VRKLKWLALILGISVLIVAALAGSHYRITVLAATIAIFILYVAIVCGPYRRPIKKHGFSCPNDD
jgi:uncharacterized membrane protein YqjE